MAEGYLKSMKLKGFEVLSRGLYAGGDAVSENSAKVMAEIGIDISGHISKGLTADDLDADMFLCMTHSHESALISLGIKREKVGVLKGEIPDPFMGSENDYRVCRDRIIAAVDDIVFCGKILPFSVKGADKGDIADIHKIERLCFSVPWSEKAIEESMDASTWFFIAKKGEETVGYIGVTFVLDEAYITNIAVKQEYRKTGLGTLLLCRAISKAIEERMSFISLEVRASNTAAINLYEKLLFKAEGIRKNFYTGPTEDAKIMTRRFFNVDTGN